MKVKIGGVEHELKYTNKGLFKIEKELNKPIIDVLVDKNELTKIHTIFALIWGGIDNGMSFDEFSEVMNIHRSSFHYQYHPILKQK